jgi:hypothetical protein
MTYVTCHEVEAGRIEFVGFCKVGDTHTKMAHLVNWRRALFEPLVLTRGAVFLCGEVKDEFGERCTHLDRCLAMNEMGDTSMPIQDLHGTLLQKWCRQSYPHRPVLRSIRKVPCHIRDSISSILPFWLR